MSFTHPSIDALAAEVADLLVAGREPEALRLSFHFVEDYDRASFRDRAEMVRKEPAEVGDPRFDALLAAVTEYSCARHAQPAPSWVDGPSRFLERWWFVSGMLSLHADAIAHSPITFARRGVFITEDALTYA